VFKVLGKERGHNRWYIWRVNKRLLF
jgi:hypothetical protein